MNRVDREIASSECDRDFATAAAGKPFEGFAIWSRPNCIGETNGFSSPWSASSADGGA